MSQSSSCKLGVSVTERLDTPRFELGELTFGTGGETLVYVQANSGVGSDVSITIDPATFTFGAGAGAFKSGSVAWTTGQYGWAVKPLAV